MVKRSIPERIGSGLLAVAVAFLCVFWSLRPVQAHAVDDFTESVINYSLNDIVKPLSETIISEYTSLDPTTIKIAEAELSFASHIAFSSLERDLVDQGVNFDPSFSGWNNLSGLYYFDDGNGTTPLQVATISWKKDLESVRFKFTSGKLGAFLYAPSGLTNLNSYVSVRDFLIYAQGNGTSNSLRYWTNLHGFDSPFGLSIYNVNSYATLPGLSLSVRPSSGSIPLHSASNPFWQFSETSSSAYYYGSADVTFRALADLQPYQFPDTGTIDPQTNYQAILDDMVSTYGQETVDEIWVSADFNNIPPVFDQFVFPGNLPGVTFPDVQIPETTLPETLWNSLAFYFQTFDQVATETGAKPVLIVFLIIALLCVMLKI